jgi:DNA recombination protein RmuC
MQLAQLLRQTLAPSQYESNVAVVPGSAERVEFAILLPVKSERPVYLPVDSKFPQEDYLRLVEASQAGDAAAAEASRKALLRRLQTEARKISDKYIAPPYTTDFAILFLPVEGLYAEALQTPDLLESLQRDLHVVLSGPGTFPPCSPPCRWASGPWRWSSVPRRSGSCWEKCGRTSTVLPKCLSPRVSAFRRRGNPSIPPFREPGFSSAACLRWKRPCKTRFPLNLNIQMN